MKYLKYILPINLLLLTFVAKAESPNWIVTPSNYSYNMAITCVVNIDNYELSNSNDTLAAFVGEECRGVASSFYQAGVNRYVFYLMAYSNTASEKISFKVYRSNQDEVIALLDTLTFQINGVIGNAENPAVLANLVLSAEADILSFAFNEQISQTTSEQNIDILMPHGTDLTDLTAIFTISENASPFIGITPQVSGITSNDFTNPIIYKVVAQNGSFQEWTVTVTENTSSIYKSITPGVSIFPNPANGLVHIRTAEDIECISFTGISGQKGRHFDSNCMDVSKFEPGTYVVEIKTRNNIYFKKLILKN